MFYENPAYISSESLIAEIKQELKSYFESGAITEILIPTFIDQALRKLRVFAYKTEEAVLNFSNYTSELPCDFVLLDRALMYDHEVEWDSGMQTVLGSWYKSIKCTDCNDCTPGEEIYETVSVTGTGFSLKMKQPRWIRVYHGSKQYCTEGCQNISVSSSNVLQITNNSKISSTFEDGCVYIRYFARPVDDDGIPMIPEILEVEEYVKSYLKFKFFELLWHSIMDESVNQIQSKFQYYRNDQLAKLQAALAYFMTYSKQHMADNMVKQKQKFFKYHIK
jgi:hypothetical protein